MAACLIGKFACSTGGQFIRFTRLMCPLCNSAISPARIRCRPGDFTQINTDINVLMVARSLRLLDGQLGGRIAD